MKFLWPNSGPHAGVRWARFIEPPGPPVSAPLRAGSRWKLQTLRGGFKELKLVQWPTTPLPRGPRRPRMKISKKIALQLPKEDFYSFKLCTADNGGGALGRWPTRPSSPCPPLRTLSTYGLAQKKITALSNLSIPALASAACNAHSRR